MQSWGVLRSAVRCQHRHPEGCPHTHQHGPRSSEVAWRRSHDWLLGRRPALDGIRAIAVLLVLLAHSRLPLVGPGGSVGVMMFFTLSGFLITSLLVEERDAFGRIKVLAFYKRRFLRLVPAMVVCVLLAMAVSLATIGRIPDWTLVFGTLSYTANWVMIGDFPMPTGLGHTWSLAIEEQFYLIWPLVIIATAAVSRRRMIGALVAVCVGVLILRAMLWDGGEGWSRIYFGTDTRADGLLYGAIVALYLHGAKERIVSEALQWGALLVVGIGCVIPFVGKEIWLPTLTSVATAVLIYSVVQIRGMWLLELPVLHWVGIRSYGIYLYQSPIHVFIMYYLGTGAVWWFLLQVPLTMLAAWASYRFIELPFLRLKDRDPRSHRGITQNLEHEHEHDGEPSRAT